MKNVIFTTVSALALAMVFTGTVSATYGDGYRHDRSRDEGTSIEVSNENTNVTTSVEVKADTGDNVQLGTGGSMGMYTMHHSRTRNTTPTQTIATGDAYATGTAMATVNQTWLPDCGCFVPRQSTDIEVKNEDTRVLTTAEVKADTGDNTQRVRRSYSYNHAPAMLMGGSTSGDQTRQVIRTGHATADGYADSWVNMTDMRVGSN